MRAFVLFVRNLTDLFVWLIWMPLSRSNELYFNNFHI